MIKFVFSLLIKAIYVACRLDQNVRESVLQLPNNYVIKFNVLPNNINVLCVVNNGVVSRIKHSNHVNLTIEFKDKKSAMLALFGIKSVAQTFCEHRIRVFGNINHSVLLTRVINTVECYLFPNFVTNRLFTPKIEREANKFKFWWLLIFGRRK